MNSRVVLKDSALSQDHAQPRKNSRGFTLIELLIGIGIVIILTATAIPVASNLQSSSQLNETTSQIIQNIRLARTYSVAGLHNATHGIYVDTAAGQAKIILYEGASYATRNANYDRVTSLESSLSVATTLTGNDVVFSKGIGTPNTTGTVTLTHSVNGTRIIRVNQFGMAEVE